MAKQLKRTLQWGLLCCSITLLSNCQQSEVENSGSNDLHMSLIANIRNIHELPNSRYVGEDPNDVVFGEYDNIGIFIDGAEAIKWTYEASEWVPNKPAYWPDKTQDHTFCAFYPYATATSTESVPMPDLKGQSGTLASISNCDFLAATTIQKYGEDGTVVFTGTDNSFEHVSTLLKLTVKGDDDLKTSIISQISIVGTNIVAPSTYSFTDKSVTLSPDATSDALTATLSHEMDGKDATFYFIVNEKKDATEIVTLSIEYTTDEKMYAAKLTNFAGNTFAGGMMQSYTLTIKDSSLFIVGSDISPWGIGETLEDIIINATEKE